MKSKREIHIVGLNSFNFDEQPLSIRNLFNKIDLIIAPETYINEIKKWSTDCNNPDKKYFASKSNKELISFILKSKNNLLIFSRGDPLCFGIGRILIENLSKEELFFHPKNTCFQIAFSRLKQPWQNTALTSTHGRDFNNLIKLLKSRKSSITIFTDPKKNDLEIIKQNLIELKLINFYDLWLCEDLGLKNEKITQIDLLKSLPTNISKLYIVILLKNEKNLIFKELPLFGLEDSVYKNFDDRPSLFTKRDIRIQLLADLELPENGIMWDIGAGSGTIGLEALKLRPNLKLFSIDKKVGTKKLISENASRLNVKPTKIIEDDINNLIYLNKESCLIHPDRLIIGGCDIKTKLNIIQKVSSSIKAGGIIVLPLIEIESLGLIKDCLKNNNFQLSLSLIQTYKGLNIAEGSRFEPNNPVFIIKARKLI